MSILISDKAVSLSSMVSANASDAYVSLNDVNGNTLINQTLIKVQNNASNTSISITSLAFNDGTSANSAIVLGGYSNLVITNTQTFNSSGTWVKPATGRFAIVRAWGGGGSGGAGVNSGAVSGGGGGGFHEAIFPIPCLTSNVTVTVGAGGNSSTANNTSIAGRGFSGGTTSFGSYLSAYGGGGGTGTTGGTVCVGGGGGGGSGGAGYTGSTGGAGLGGPAANNIGLCSYIPMIVSGFISSTNTTAMTTNVVFIPSGPSNFKNGSGSTSYQASTSTYGGGAGGFTSVSTNTAGGNSVFGGGGGGSSNTGAAAGGISTYGGNGSSATFSSANVNGTAGFQPAGGSGGVYTSAGTRATSGAGGAGQVIVYVY